MVTYDGRRYAMKADGQRILFVDASVDERSRALSVVFNWTTTIAARTPEVRHPRRAGGSMNGAASKAVRLLS